MYPHNVSQNFVANNSEMQPGTPKKSKPKNNKPMTPRKGCKYLTWNHFN